MSGAIRCGPNWIRFWLPKNGEPARFCEREWQRAFDEASKAEIDLFINDLGHLQGHFNNQRKTDHE